MDSLEKADTAALFSPTSDEDPFDSIFAGENSDLDPEIGENPPDPVLQSSTMRVPAPENELEFEKSGLDQEPVIRDAVEGNRISSIITESIDDNKLEDLGKKFDGEAELVSEQSGINNVFETNKEDFESIRLNSEALESAEVVSSKASSEPIDSVNPVQLKPIEDLVSDPVSQLVTEPVEPVSESIEPVLEPISAPVEPVSESIEPILEPISAPVETISEPITEPVEPIEPVSEPAPRFEPENPQVAEAELTLPTIAPSVESTLEHAGVESVPVKRIETQQAEPNEIAESIGITDSIEHKQEPQLGDLTKHADAVKPEEPESIENSDSVKTEEPESAIIEESAPVIAEEVKVSEKIQPSEQTGPVIPEPVGTKPAQLAKTEPNLDTLFDDQEADFFEQIAQGEPSEEPKPEVQSKFDAIWLDDDDDDLLESEPEDLAKPKDVAKSGNEPIAPALLEVDKFGFLDDDNDDEVNIEEPVNLQSVSTQPPIQQSVKPQPSKSSKYAPVATQMTSPSQNEHISRVTSAPGPQIIDFPSPVAPSAPKAEKSKKPKSAFFQEPEILATPARPHKSRAELRRQHELLKAQKQSQLNAANPNGGPIPGPGFGPPGANYGPAQGPPPGSNFAPPQGPGFGIPGSNRVPPGPGYGAPQGYNLGHGPAQGSNFGPGLNQSSNAGPGPIQGPNFGPGPLNGHNFGSGLAQSPTVSSETPSLPSKSSKYGPNFSNGPKSDSGSISGKPTRSSSSKYKPLPSGPGPVPGPPVIGPGHGPHLVTGAHPGPHPGPGPAANYNPNLGPNASTIGTGIYSDNSGANPTINHGSRPSTGLAGLGSAPPLGYGAPPPGFGGAPPSGTGAPPPGLGTAPPSGIGAPPPGFGSAPPPPGFGSAPPPGLGTAPPPGLGSAPPPGFGSAAGLTAANASNVPTSGTRPTHPGPTSSLSHNHYVPPELTKGHYLPYVRGKNHIQPAPQVTPHAAPQAVVKQDSAQVLESYQSMQTPVVSFGRGGKVVVVQIKASESAYAGTELTTLEVMDTKKVLVQEPKIESYPLDRKKGLLEKWLGEKIQSILENPDPENCSLFLKYFQDFLRCNGATDLALFYTGFAQTLSEHFSLVAGAPMALKLYKTVRTDIDNLYLGQLSKSLMLGDSVEKCVEKNDFSMGLLLASLFSKEQFNSVALRFIEQTLKHQNKDGLLVYFHIRSFLGVQEMLASLSSEEKMFFEENIFHILAYILRLAEEHNVVVIQDILVHFGAYFRDFSQNKGNVSQICFMLALAPCETIRFKLDSIMAVIFMDMYVFILEKRGLNPRIDPGIFKTRIDAYMADFGLEKSLLEKQVSGWFGSTSQLHNVFNKLIAGEEAESLEKSRFDKVNPNVQPLEIMTSARLASLPMISPFTPVGSTLALRLSFSEASRPVPNRLAASESMLRKKKNKYGPSLSQLPMLPIGSGPSSGTPVSSGPISGPIPVSGPISGPIPNESASEYGQISQSKPGSISGPSSGPISGPIPSSGPLSGPLTGSIKSVAPGPIMSPTSGPIMSPGLEMGPILDTGASSNGPFSGPPSVSGHTNGHISGFGEPDLVSSPPAAGPTISGHPVTNPPAAGPPVVSPPVASPPVASPPVASPPVASPPVASPPVASPPVAGPPVTSPPVTSSQAVDLPASGPSITGPPVTEPPVSSPPVAKPPASGPSLSGPPASGPPASGNSVATTGPPISNSAGPSSGPPTRRKPRRKLRYAPKTADDFFSTDSPAKDSPQASETVLKPEEVPEPQASKQTIPQSIAQEFPQAVPQEFPQQELLIGKSNENTPDLEKESIEKNEGFGSISIGQKAETTDEGTNLNEAGINQNQELEESKGSKNELSNIIPPPAGLPPKKASKPRKYSPVGASSLSIEIPEKAESSGPPLPSLVIAPSQHAIFHARQGSSLSLRFAPMEVSEVLQDVLFGLYNNPSFSAYEPVTHEDIASLMAPLRGFEQPRYRNGSVSSMGTASHVATYRQDDTIFEEDEDEDEDEDEEKPKKKEIKKEHKAVSRKQSWFSLQNWIPEKKDGKRVYKAKLGEANSFYFDEKLGRWIDKNKPVEEQMVKAPPPPPKMSRGPASSSGASADLSRSQSLGKSSLGGPPVNASDMDRKLTPSVGYPKTVKSESLEELLSRGGTAKKGSKRKTKRGYVNVLETMQKQT